MKRKLTAQILLYFTAALVLMCSTVGGIFLIIYTRTTVHNYRSGFLQKTEAIAHSLSVYFEQELPEYYPIESGLKEQMKQSNLRLGIYLDFMDNIALSNLWIVDSATQTIHVEFGKYNITYSSIPAEVRTLIDQAMEGETSISERWSDRMLEKNFIIASPVQFSDGRTVAVVVIHARTGDMFSTIMEAGWVLAGSMLLALLVLIVPCLIFSRNIVNPLKCMVEITVSMTKGDYTAKTGVKRQDELGVLANNIDILSVRLKEADRKQAELEQLRKTYISNISHELRTPVAVIRSSLEALCDGVVTGQEQVEAYYREMLAESVHMNRMVNDLLELSRLQNPSYHIEKQPIDFMMVVEDAVRTLRHIAQNAGHVIELNIKDGEIFPFCGDYGRLRQMLGTVLDNAIKFSIPGEPIQVTVTIDVSGCTTRINNRGTGIQEMDLPHVFEEYYMSIGETNRTGTGLGLAIAKRIADRHSIGIEATSVPGEKTSFIFRIPWQR
ncbi:histidine kinase [Lacrimispora sphenoides]|jgi:signal transduction histidine kinase|uniref:sensor histidine kinase n=1 Tax=Lacrimispora sphenoides TaxID=29370 RepID=UPI0008AE109D|nr:HAMP domain-containing sensor histidine kinase [Lacrimispora sphenoides]SET48073.1 histidine kinase [Lacrimispora sphenoides]